MAVLYIFTEPRTLYDCVAHLSRMHYLLCCCSFWKSNSISGNMSGRHGGDFFVITVWSRLYPILAATLLLLGLVYSTYISVTDPEKRERIFRFDKLLLSIGTFEIIMSTCMFVITSSSMQRNSKRVLRLYDRIHALDQRLVREFGANLNYRKLMRKNNLVMTVLISIYGFTIFNAVLQLSSGDFVVILMAASCYFITTTASHFNNYVHMNFADLLRIRFRLLCRILANNQLQHKCPTDEQKQRYFAAAVDMVKELHYMVADINGIFKVCLLTATTHDFTLTTSELYMMFGHSDSGAQNVRIWIYIAICMIMPMYKMIVAPIYCDLAIQEGSKCLRLIEQLDVVHTMQGGALRELVAGMMYWRLEHKINFTSGLNMIFNRTIIAGIISVIVNYMFILMQFRFTQQMGDQIEQQKHFLQDWIGDIDVDI